MISHNMFTPDRFMKPKAAAADGGAASPAKDAGPRFQLPPSPSQQKLHGINHTQAGASRAADRQQPRRLFADAAGAAEPDDDQVASSAARSAAADGAAALSAAADAEPIAMWDARSHSDAQQCVQPVSGQPSPGQDSAAAPGAARQPSSGCVIDLDDGQWTDSGQLCDSEAAAAAGEQPLAEPPDVQPPESAAMPVSTARQQAAGTSAAPQPPKADAYMPTSMDQVRDSGNSGLQIASQMLSASAAACNGVIFHCLLYDVGMTYAVQVDADALSALPLELQAEIRHSLRQSSGVPPQRTQQCIGGAKQGKRSAARQKRIAGRLSFQPNAKRKSSK